MQYTIWLGRELDNVNLYDTLIWLGRENDNFYLGIQLLVL